MAKARTLSIPGWVLIFPEEDRNGKPKGTWYIAWDERFPTKRAAIEFARTHTWPSGYRAVRGELRADQ